MGRKNPNTQGGPEKGLGSVAGCPLKNSKGLSGLGFCGSRDLGYWGTSSQLLKIHFLLATKEQVVYGGAVIGGT